MAVVQTVLSLNIDDQRTLNVVLEDRSARVKFSLKSKDGKSYQRREEWYLSRAQSMRLAKFLANIQDAVPSQAFDDETTPVDRPRQGTKEETDEDDGSV